MFIKSYPICDKQNKTCNEFQLSVNTRLCVHQHGLFIQQLAQRGLKEGEQLL